MECCDILMGALMIAAMLFAVTAGSVPGSETDLLKEVSETGPGCEADLHDELGGGQVWRHAHPVGIGHAPVFQQNKVLPCGFPGMKFLERFIVHALRAKMGATLMLWGIGCWRASSQSSLKSIWEATATAAAL